MAKTKISDFNSNPALNTDIDSINLAEGCAPSGINDAIRELMSQLKDWQSGTSNDPYVVGSSGSLTLNQGTANTVPYLNGSKVVTSGTALSFDGTNLGLGVTPSAWASFYRGFDISTYGAVYGASTNNAGLINNAYFNGTNWIYKNTAAASNYSQSGGTHAFYNAASGTAGNAITFTQAMTLDASGNLALGSTSILGSTNRASFTNNVSAKGVLALSNTSSSGYSAVELYDNAGGQQGAIGWGNGSVAVTGAQNATYLYSSGAITFLAGGTSEHARIGSSGGLSIAGGLAVGSLTSFPTSIFFSGSVVSAGAGVFPLKWNNSSGIVTYDTSSRLVKTNIEDSPYGLAEVLQLKSRKYQRIDSQQNEIGLVADEVLPVMPEFVPLVEKSLFTKDEADKELIAGGVNYDKLTSVLIKAIQEQQAIIESLKARLDAANL